ncbi:MAG TPA: acetyl-CoA carboxylase, carboxyltransferase subunit beta [Longimicrobiales bacterium]|jgi:acetyl-CoA carboxylase carboxyl transferase subunit beta
MAWFRKEKKPLKASDRRDVPGDVFEKCRGCGEIVYGESLAQNQGVCRHCGFHFRITPERYVDILLDEGSFEETEEDLRSVDPLEFTDLKPYRDRIDAAEAKVGTGEAVITGRGAIEGIGVCVALMDFRFIGGSMGSVVGEKIARCGRVALDERRPLIVVNASGGARMQEGIYSLMQMAKTSVVLSRLHEAGVPYLSICTDPTTGGVTASYAMLGDVNLAEPGALIGFAGPRVIEETIRQELPQGFQRAEFLEEHGMVDRVVDRRELRDTVALLLRHMLRSWED